MDFYSAVQAFGEQVKEYFTKCSQKVVDCAFQCPKCDSDISEYMLLHKLAARLRKSTFKCDAFQSCDHGVDSLRTYCVAYKAMHRDATVGTRHEAVVAVDVTDDIIAAAQVASH